MPKLKVIHKAANLFVRSILSVFFLISYFGYICIHFSFLQQGKCLRDGLPQLQRFISMSSPHIPTEFHHARCTRIVRTFPCANDVSEQVLNSPYHDSASSRANVRKYATEADIIHFVRTYMENINSALETQLAFSAEVCIQHIRPDLCVLRHERSLVGVVEVKKPGKNVLSEPTVLGELFDQMLLIEGFYGTGPVIGILTTGEEWAVAWFPSDTETLTALSSEPQVGIGEVMEEVRDGLMTASNQTPQVEEHASNRVAPRKLTDTAPKNELYCNNESFNSRKVVTSRLLNTTQVFNAQSQYPEVLKLLCNAFQCMMKARKYHYVGSLPRCLVGFRRDAINVTFHPLPNRCWQEAASFERTKFPRSDVKLLLGVKDLGRGASGKAWLCSTASCTAVCVLKFNNENDLMSLKKECDMWHLIYPEFASQVKVERWSGSPALVMPYFTAVLEEERDQLKDKVHSVLVNKFASVGKQHNDVAWRNIGKYLNKKGEVDIVLFDLEGLSNTETDSNSSWIDSSMKQLSYFEI
jgi:hypothetical protein